MFFSHPQTAATKYYICMKRTKKETGWQKKTVKNQNDYRLCVCVCVYVRHCITLWHAIPFIFVNKPSFSLLLYIHTLLYNKYSFMRHSFFCFYWKIGRARHSIFSLSLYRMAMVRVSFLTNKMFSISDSRVDTLAAVCHWNDVGRRRKRWSILQQNRLNLHIQIIITMMIIIKSKEFFLTSLCFW